MKLSGLLYTAFAALPLIAVAGCAVDKKHGLEIKIQPNPFLLWNEKPLPFEPEIPRDVWSITDNPNDSYEMEMRFRSYFRDDGWNVCRRFWQSEKGRIKDFR